MQSMKKSKNRLKEWYLRYFDWNRDGKVNWWEYLIPFGLVLLIEVIAEIIGIFLTRLFF